MMDLAKNHDRYMVPGLERGLRLLGVFSRTQPELSLAELARHMRLSRSTVFRITYTLEQLGFLRRTKTGFQVGPRVLTLGSDYLASLDLVDIAKPELTRLRDETGASAHLAVLDGVEVIYLVQVASLKRLASSVTVGTRFPAHATSMGRLMLGGLADAELERRYRDVKLAAFTDETPTTFDALRRRIAEDRARGYVVSRGGFERGIVAVTAPVFDFERRVVAAINVSGPATDFEDSALETAIKERVLAAADRISARLGGRTRTEP